MITKILEEIFQDVLELDSLPPAEELQQIKFPKWDSMMQLNLVSAIESEFDIVLSLNEAKSIDSFKAALEIIENKT